MEFIAIIVVLGPLATAGALLILLRARPQSSLGEAAAALAAARPSRRWSVESITPTIAARGTPSDMGAVT